MTTIHTTICDNCNDKIFTLDTCGYIYLSNGYKDNKRYDFCPRCFEKIKKFVRGENHEEVS